ncbi:hypothetical protein CRV24_001370 [Beauveria bassiana]|nr:hypothetical protein CRV24_001370 [Beauveria bassiana]KAH8720038.1 hypothetical protein HC256_000446 [Beauveria bassiana]
MKSNDISLESTIVGSVSTPEVSLSDTKFNTLLRHAGLSPPEPLVQLARPDDFEFEALVTDNNRAYARALLVRARSNDPEYRPPDQQKRHLLRMPTRKSLKMDGETWTFTKHEVGKAFNNLFEFDTLPDIGVAQALLSFVEDLHSLDELWEHFQDSKLQKRQSSIFRRSASTSRTTASWLETATEQGNTHYIRLICQIGVRQVLLDHAFIVALKRQDMASIHMLAEFGASISSINREVVQGYVKRGNVDVVRLLLAAPNELSTEDWQHCFQEEITASAQGLDVVRALVQCLHYESSIASGKLLLKALEAQNTAAVAVLLAYRAICKAGADTDAAWSWSPTGNHEEHETIAIQACLCVSEIAEPGTRYTFYSLLNVVGLLRACPALELEMDLSVRNRRLPMIRLLINAGMWPPIQGAVATMDFALLEIMVHTRITPEEASKLVSFVPEPITEDDMVRFLNIFSRASKSLQGPLLDQWLVRAVKNKRRRLVHALLQVGATVTFESAAAIRAALGAMDTEMLQILLREKISSKELSPALPVAMNITDGAFRRQVVWALADKGVQKEALINALSRVVQSPSPDLELIRLILKYKILTKHSSQGLDVFRIAIKQGNLAIIRLLCEGRPDAVLLAEAVTEAFSQLSQHGHDVTFTIVDMLLQNGARGPPLDAALILVAGSDRPRAQDTARLLIGRGAGANHLQGSAYMAACTSSNYPMLAILCKGCPMQPASLRRLLGILLKAANLEAEALEMVLKSAVASSAATINTACTPKLLSGSRHLASTIPRLLHHGLDINLADGEILRMVVQENSISLLERALTSPGLTTGSLKKAFKATQEIKPRDNQLKMMALLLHKAKFSEIGQSDRLSEETMEALSSDGDRIGLHLLLREKASVNADGGKALRIAAAMSVSSTAVLESLLRQSPSGSTIGSSCRAALASPKLDQRQTEAVLKLLLASKTSLTEAEMADLLEDSIKRLGDSTFLPSILIKRHAKVSSRHLQAALARSSKELFELLVRNFGPDKDKKFSFFSHVVSKAPIKSDRRLWIYDTMLSNWKIPQACVSEALVSALESVSLADVALPKLLLQHGAEVTFKNLLPLKLSFKLRDGTEISELLIKHIKDGDAAVAVFRFARASSALNPASKLRIYGQLLKKHKMSKGLASELLIDTLKDGQDVASIRFLLAQGAKPAQDGAKCFLLAYRAGNGTAFKAMCPYAEFDAISRALLEHSSQEKHVITWLGLCVGTLAPPAARIKDPKLLYEAMRKFPDGGALVGRFLEYGASAGTLAKWSLCKEWEVEQVTPLLWALFQPEKVSNHTLLALIARGKEGKLLYAVVVVQRDTDNFSAHPLYLTPKSQVSAAFACMLDPARTPILKALLKQHREPITASIIPGRSFSYLGQRPSRPTYEEMVKEDLPLSTAALYLGNLKAYRALGGGENADDGSLHTAAMLALPDFVEWLLERHSADLSLEKFGMMIPLAIACHSQDRPWCKVAKTNGSFENRQKQTMRLLASRTDLSWRHRRKTVLHFAIDNGPGVVKAMLQVLNVAQDPERNNRYQYIDREGIAYSLTMYISHLLNPGTKKSESKEMIEILKNEGKLEDRMYRSRRRECV